MKLLSAAELTLTGLRGSRPSGAEELGGKIIRSESSVRNDAKESYISVSALPRRDLLSCRIEHIAAGAPREVRGSTQPETEAPHLQTEVRPRPPPPAHRDDASSV